MSIVRQIRGGTRQRVALRRAHGRHAASSPISSASASRSRASGSASTRSATCRSTRRASGRRAEHGAARRCSRRLQRRGLPGACRRTIRRRGSPEAGESTASSRGEAMNAINHVAVWVAGDRPVHARRRLVHAAGTGRGWPASARRWSSSRRSTAARRCRTSSRSSPSLVIALHARVARCPRLGAASAGGRREDRRRRSALGAHRRDARAELRVRGAPRYRCGSSTPAT